MTWDQYAAILGGCAATVVLALLIDWAGNRLAYGRHVVDNAPVPAVDEFDRLLEASGVYDPDSPFYNAVAEFERNRAKRSDL